MPQIPITKPFFGKEEKELLVKPLETGWLVQGPYVSEFEKLFSAYIGINEAKAVSNCTTALHLALRAFDIGSGDKVVVPSFTYIATANVVEYTGARVQFCDIDLNSFNIDVNQLEYLLSKDKKKEIKAVIPVNLFGLCADLPAIKKLAEKYTVRVIEDSACGFGAYIGEKHSGTFGDIGCFSFHPRKSITTGEGGMVVSNNRDTINLVASLRDHGASKSDHARHVEHGGSLLPDFDILGYNYRMTDMQGALGVAQMGKADYILKSRREIASRYNMLFADNEFLITPDVADGYTHGYQSYVCLYGLRSANERPDSGDIDTMNKKRNAAMAELEKRGIATRQGTHAVHTLGYYQKKYCIEPGDFPNSYAADRLSISLPLYAGMTEKEFEYAAANLIEVIR